ncbi:TRAP transporter large permease [Aureimonas glaciei]|uniref:TRAP transporter large permease protein n=1 Tax=Aureimonas glaciei TaxID=1776957 RepID=A0A916YCW3_9HYPH|nr:TRAP transporter large permease [Aureimonas glaciei]GGD39925.1 membrane protein [Aureimonas glaciei]
MIGTSLGLLLALLAIGIPVAVTLVLLALILGTVFSPMSLWSVFGELSWSASSEFTLFAIPLYILLGEILLRSGISEKMYHAISLYLSRLPGGLMHANLGFSTVFAAMSGSSVACAATLGKVANPLIGRYGYNERLFLGTIAAGGTLGILIPPSIPLILYGVLTETSIPQLYLAGIIPGLLLAALFMLTVVIACWWRPAWGGTPVVSTWRMRIAVLPDLIPPLIIVVAVIGAIYAGIATPTESAALGVVMAILLSAWRRSLSWRMIVAAGEATVITTAMLTLIVIAAFLLNFVLSAIGLSQVVTNLFTASGLSPTGLIITAIVFYLVLGMFLESLSMLIATVPLIVPALRMAGIDTVWFGILMMVLMEVALLTPPVGMNLFVVQGTRDKGDVRDVIIGALPFVAIMFVFIALLVAFPDIALWLPRVLSV